MRRGHHQLPIYTLLLGAIYALTMPIPQASADPPLRRVADIVQQYPQLAKTEREPGIKQRHVRTLSRGEIPDVIKWKVVHAFRDHLSSYHRFEQPTIEEFAKHIATGVTIDRAEVASNVARRIGEGWVNLGVYLRGSERLAALDRPVLSQPDHKNASGTWGLDVEHVWTPEGKAFWNVYEMLANIAADAQDLVEYVRDGQTIPDKRVLEAVDTQHFNMITGFISDHFETSDHAKQQFHPEMLHERMTVPRDHYDSAVEAYVPRLDSELGAYPILQFHMARADSYIATIKEAAAQLDAWSQTYESTDGD